MDLSLPIRVASLAGDLRQAKRYYGVGWGYVLRRFFGPMRRRGLDRRPGIAAGLLDPRIPAEALGAAISRQRLMQMQRRVNPKGYAPLTEEKVIFYAYCSARNLPVPRFYGLSAKPAGYSADGLSLAGPRDWATFARSLPDEFIVKPSHGVYGRGVRLIRRKGTGFVDDLGQHADAENLSSLTFTYPGYDSFVIQERLRNHSDLGRLSGAENLQTVRIVSWVRDNGHVLLPYAALRVIASDSLIDNYDNARTGNLMAFAEISSGELEAAVGPTSPGGLPSIHQVHPRTSLSIVGFRLPFWNELCDLVRRAAAAFVPLRTIGWDVAITPNGPVLVEGNTYWDPYNRVPFSTRREVVEPAAVFLAELEAVGGEKR